MKINSKVIEIQSFHVELAKSDYSRISNYMSIKSGFFCLFVCLKELLNYIVLLGREFKEHQYYTVLISHNIDSITHLW